MKNKKIFIDEAAARSLAEKRFIQTGLIWSGRNISV